MVYYKLSGQKKNLSILGIDQFQWACQPPDPDCICRCEGEDGGSALNGREIVVSFDEQIVYNQLDHNENAIWSLLLASGYLKVKHVDYRGITREPWYTLDITNIETLSMFTTMFQDWFQNQDANYGYFMKALINGDLEAMNYYMNKVALATFSYFDVGSGNRE